MSSTKINDIVRRRYNKAQEIFQPITDNVEINRNLYRGIMNVDDTYDWDYSLVDPQVFPLVRNYLSRSNPAMSNIRLDPRNADDYEKKEVNQQFLNWEIGELMMTSLFYRMYFSSYLTGKGYLKDGWKHQKAVKIQIKDKNGKVTDTKILKNVTDRADAKFVRFNDLLIPNRNNPNLFEQPYVFELQQKLVGEMLDENEALQETGDKPYWDTKWLTGLRKAGVKSQLLDYQIDMVDDGEEIDADDLAFRSAYVPLMCMSTLDGEIFYLPIDADSDTIINKDTENPYWHGHYPYIDFTPFPEDDEFYSMALVDVVGDLQIAATEILNQTLTNIRQINNDMWVAGTSAAQTPDWQFKRRPDGIIRVAGDASQIQNIRTQDNTPSALRAGQVVSDKLEKAGGISSLYASGTPSQGVNQTARGAQIIDQNIDTNMRMIVDLFGEQVIKRLGEHFLELNAQYVTEDQTFFITGKKGVRDFIAIGPQNISANFDVSVNAERMVKQTPASRQASLQNTITVVQGIANNSHGSLQVDITPLVDALIDATPDMENVDDVILTVDEKGKRDMMSLERGQMPEIKVIDPHQQLVMYANIWFQDNQANYTPQIKDLFAAYLQKHADYIKAQQQLAAMTAPQPPKISETIGFKDLPPEGQVQMAKLGGINIQPQTPPANMGTQTGTPGQGPNLGSLISPGA